jgi:KaiC/GvpD/RAD55 family RecA-like ATPase
VRVLSRALRHQGEPIPLPWPELPIRPGPGDVVLGLAAPGVGKSFMALNWAVYLARQGRPVLMHSTDTDYPDQAVRTAALLSGETTEVVEKNQEKWADWLSGQNLPIRWSDIHIGAEEFADLLKAEVEFLGVAPEFVVVDIAGDMLNGQEENVGSMRNIFTQLKKVARRFHTTIYALHHVKRGPAASGVSVVKLADGLYAGEGVVQVVLGMWRPGEETLRVAVLKNRMGKAQPEGLLACDLRVDYSRARVSSKLAVWS